MSKGGAPRTAGFYWYQEGLAPGAGVGAALPPLLDTEGNYRIEAGDAVVLALSGFPSFFRGY